MQHPSFKVTRFGQRTGSFRINFPVKLLYTFNNLKSHMFYYSNISFVSVISLLYHANTIYAFYYAKQSSTLMWAHKLRCTRHGLLAGFKKYFDFKRRFLTILKQLHSCQTLMNLSNLFICQLHSIQIKKRPF